MPEPRPISPYQLKIWALFILYKLAHHSKPGGYERGWMLRFLLAFLYSHASDGARAPFDGYWKAATRAQEEGKPDRTAAYERGMTMRRQASAICRAVGEEPKAIQDRFWDELTREAYAARGEKLRIFK
jgi:hypothetical protein